MENNGKFSWIMYTTSKESAGNKVMGSEDRYRVKRVCHFIYTGYNLH